MKRPRIPTLASSNFVKVFSTDKLSEQFPKKQGRRVEHYMTKKTSSSNHIEYRDVRY